MVDYKALSEQFDVPVDKVKAKCEKYIKDIKVEISEFFTDDKLLNAKAEELLASNLYSLFSLSGLAYAKKEAAKEKATIKEINCLIFGVSPVEDRNDYARRQARNLYYKDLDDGTEVSTDEGWVRIAKREDGSKYPIPIFHDKTIKDREGNEIPNPRYGQDIPYDGKRNIMMVVNSMGATEMEKLEIASLRWDSKEATAFPAIGKKSIVYGRQAGKTLSLNKDAYEDFGDYLKTWDVAERILQASDYWKDLCDVVTMDPYTVFVTKASVMRHKPDENDNTKIKLRINDSDVAEGINLSTRYPPVVADVENLHQGDEVIVVGKKMQFNAGTKDARNVLPYYQLWGVIVNNSTENEAMRDKLLKAGLIK